MAGSPPCLTPPSCDPELRFTPAGAAVVAFTVAVNPADAIGVDMTWATLQVKRTRHGTDATPPDDPPWTTGSTTGPAAGVGVGAGQEPPF